MLVLTRQRIHDVYHEYIALNWPGDRATAFCALTFDFGIANTIDPKGSFELALSPSLQLEKQCKCVQKQRRSLIH